MTTVEKLFVQIFERKSSVIKKLKQQADLYTQYLASKLLVDGIAPPSWLWNSNTSSNSSEVNKEELLSKFLRPYPQPAVCCSAANCSTYGNLVVTGNSEDFLERVFKDDLNADKVLNGQDDPTVPEVSRKDYDGCYLDDVPERESSVNLPVDWTEQRILNDCHALDQSLVGIQRSRSRKKALELCKSTKVLSKSGSSHENMSSDLTSTRLSLLDNQGGKRDDLSGVSGSQSCEHLDFGVADHQTIEKPLDVYPCRITRYRSQGQVPLCVRDSLTLGCSSEECKGNPSSHVSKARIDGSISIFDSEQRANCINQLPNLGTSSTIYNQSCGGRKEDKGTNFCTDRVSSPISIKSQSCACDLSKSGCSSDNYLSMGITAVESEDAHLPPDYVDGLLVCVSPNIPSEGCVARDSFTEHCKTSREKDTVPYQNSGQQKVCVEEVWDLEMPSDCAQANVAIVSPSCRRSTQQVNKSDKALKLVKSVGLFHRVAISQIQPNDKVTYNAVDYSETSCSEDRLSKQDCKQKSANTELKNTTSSQYVPPCYEVHDVLDEGENTGFFISSDLSLLDHVGQLGSSSSCEQKRQLGSIIATSDSFVFVEQMKLNSNEIEECNLEGIVASPGKKTLANSSKKMCSLSSFAVSPDKRICSGENHQLSLSKQSPGLSDILCEVDETRRDSFEFDAQENIAPQAEKSTPVACKCKMFKNSKDYTEAKVNCTLYEVCQETETMQSEMVDIAHKQIHPLKLHGEHKLESLPEQHYEEGIQNGEGKDKNQLMLTAPHRNNLRSSNCHISTEEPAAESCVFADKRKQFSTQESQNIWCLEGKVLLQHAGPSFQDTSYSALRSPHGENSSLDKGSRHCMKSWPQLKRRKIEHQQVHVFRARRPHSIQTVSSREHLKNMEINIDIVSMDPFTVVKSPNVETCQEMDFNRMEGIESSLLSQNGEVGLCYKDNSLSVVNAGDLGTALMSSMSNKEARNSQEAFVEQMKTPHSSGTCYDASKLGDGQCSQNLCDSKNTNKVSHENLNLTIEGIQPPKWVGISQTKHSIVPPSIEDLEHADVDKSMAVFDGFIIGSQESTSALGFDANGIEFDKVALPRNAIERASILAEICRSASLDAPQSNFSPTFEFPGGLNLSKTVSNGGLDNSDFESTLPLNSDVGKQLQSGVIHVDDYHKDALELMMYSDCLAYCGAQYGMEARNQNTSPVGGKLWERLSSHTGSSEKCLSSNPEFICFPIEEDPGSSKENRSAVEYGDDVQEANESSSANGDKRQPFKDLTNLDMNPCRSSHDKPLKADSADFVSTKLSVAGIQDKFELGAKNQLRDDSATREKQMSCFGFVDGRIKQTSSICSNVVRKAKQSINNGIIKPVMSNKCTLKNQKLSLKEHRGNRIISNVSSFIPLMQKQAAAVCGGKRDVKVKALKAAKRLEEKRENECKMLKEACKLERAKLEETNWRNMKLHKEKNKEEHKKKDADIIARKRLREEEERKERKMKRMRLEERLHQWKLKEKVHTERAVKEKQHTKDNEMNSNKEFHNGSKRQQKGHITEEDAAALIKKETKLIPAKFVMNHKEYGTSTQSCEAAKAMQTVDKSPRHEDLIVPKDQAKSYEISPYQCSDDEDEEDDVLPTKKYIPSWASKSIVALLLPLQQKLNTDVIFPLESFCSTDEGEPRRGSVSQ